MSRSSCNQSEGFGHTWFLWVMNYAYLHIYKPTCANTQWAHIHCFLSVCPSWFVEPTLCTTLLIQGYVVHHCWYRATLCIIDLRCAPSTSVVHHGTQGRPSSVATHTFPRLLYTQTGMCFVPTVYLPVSFGLLKSDQLSWLSLKNSHYTWVIKYMRIMMD